MGLIEPFHVRLLHKDLDSRPLTITRATPRKNPRSEKYTTNAGLLNKTSRSSRECVGSGTIPNIAISTAPPAMRMVPRTIQAENTSPRSRRAKKAFHNSDTAPSGARMTTGSDAIWNSEPKMFENMYMPTAEDVQQYRSWGVDNDELTETEQPQPDEAEKSVIRAKEWVLVSTHGRRYSFFCSCSGRA